MRFNSKILSTVVQFLNDNQVEILFCHPNLVIPISYNPHFICGINNIENIQRRFLLNGYSSEKNFRMTID